MAKASMYVSDDTQPYAGPQSEIEYLLTGRILIATGEEFECSARNVTVHSAEVLLTIEAPVGQIVVCYFDKIGLLPGKVSARSQDGFTVTFSVKLSRRERVTAQLKWQSHLATQIAELLRAPRLVPFHRSVEVRLGERLVLHGSINNISMSGAAITLSGAEIPFMGTRVRVGARYAVVVRLIQAGIAVQFEQPFTSHNFDERVRP